MKESVEFFNKLCKLIDMDQFFHISLNRVYMETSPAITFNGWKRNVDLESIKKHAFLKEQREHKNLDAMEYTFSKSNHIFKVFVNE